jgi:hypothetical protein
MLHPDLVPPVIALGLAFVCLAFAMNCEGLEKEHWKQAAAKLGLLASAPFGEGQVLRGKLGQHGVEITEVNAADRDGHAVPFTRIVIGANDLGHGLSLCDRPSARLWRGEIAFESPATGDEAFDARVCVWNAQLSGFASLTQRARGQVLALLDWGALAVQPRRLCLVVPGPMVQVSPSLPVILRQCLDVAQRLSSASGDAADALAASARSDPAIEVRVRCLEVLGRHFADTAAARRAVEEALVAEHPRVRVAGASLFPGPAAFDCLTAVLESCPLDGQAQARALGHLVDSYPDRDLSTRLAVALQSGFEPLWQVAAEAAAGSAHVDRLEKLIAGSPHDKAEVQDFAARTEQALVRRLVTSPLVAARALGCVGTLAAIEPMLKSMREVSPLGGARGAVRDAVREIQQRLGGGQGGGLSLAETAETIGALSLAPLTPSRQ